MKPLQEYDPRYLSGIALFNQRDFFEAHEIWESLWLDCPASSRRFYQALIQAAVAVYHGCNGNFAGARRLFHSGRKYMSAYPSPYLGLDGDAFWRQMERALGAILDETCPKAHTVDPEAIPLLELDPPASERPVCHPSATEEGGRTHE